MERKITRPSAQNLDNLKFSLMCIPFIPINNTKINLFGLGEKVVPNVDCSVAYKNVCDYSTNYMDLVLVDMFKNVIFGQLNMV